jgi:photosystem II stability/assembly factor-like uncharacterized protein
LYKTVNGGRSYRLMTRVPDSLDAGSWVTPMDMAETNPNFIVQARNKNVWRSLNGGTTWLRMSNFPQGNAINLTHAVAVAPTSTNVVFVSRTTQDSNAAIQRYLWRTDNGGLDWVNVFDPVKFPTDGTLTDIAISPFDADKIWVSFSVGYAESPSQSKKIFVTTDGGANWTNITEGLPSVPIWTIAVQHNSSREAIYVGTAIGVFYRDNIMNQFVAWQTGMPKGLTISDLKVHEATGKVYAGTFGRGIWVADVFSTEAVIPNAGTPQPANQNFQVAPNPSRGSIQVSLKMADTQPLELFISDATGKVVFTQNQFTGTATCDLSQLPNGLYFVKVKTEKELLVKKVILSK